MTTPAGRRRRVRLMILAGQARAHAATDGLAGGVPHAVVERVRWPRSGRVFFSGCGHDGGCGQEADCDADGVRTGRPGVRLRIFYRRDSSTGRRGVLRGRRAEAGFAATSRDRVPNPSDALNCEVPRATFPELLVGRPAPERKNRDPPKVEGRRRCTPRRSGALKSTPLIGNRRGSVRRSARTGADKRWRSDRRGAGGRLIRRDGRWRGGALRDGRLLTATGSLAAERSMNGPRVYCAVSPGRVDTTTRHASPASPWSAAR